MRVCEGCGGLISDGHRRCQMCARGDRRDHRLGDLLTLDSITRLLTAMAKQARRVGDEDMRWMMGRGR